jgi:hypothetical protein
VKLQYRATFMFALVVSLSSVLFAQEPQEAQEALPTIADIAREERAKRKEFASEEKNVAIHTQALSKHVFSAHILFMDSKEAIEKWAASPSIPRPMVGQIQQVRPGVKFYVPFAVTNYRFPNENMNLTAQVRISDPKGTTLVEVPKVSTAVRRDPRSPDVIILNPVLDLEFDEADPRGTYMIRVVISDLAHNITASAEAAVLLVEHD